MAGRFSAGRLSDPEKGCIPYNDFSQANTASVSRSSHEGGAVTVNDHAVNKRYLTFDTALPVPNPVSAKGGSHTQPSPPNLSKLENPQSWHWLKKWMAVASCSFACLMVAYNSSSYAFAVPMIADEFQVSISVANIGLTAFNLGFAFTPMLCAPLSESIGRYPVFVVSGVLFVITQVCCAVTTTYAGMVVSRFLTGCGASTFSTIVGGVISDIFIADARNAPMAVFSSQTMFGVGVGLSISGAIVEHLNWRWVFYVPSILSAAAVLIVIVFMKETRSNVVLRRRAEALNKWYAELEDQGFIGVTTPLEEGGDISKLPGEKDLPSKEVKYEIIRWSVEADVKRPKMLALVGTSIVRPFRMLFTEYVVFFFSLWAMFAWSILYITFESVPLVFRVSHGFDNYQNGLVFLAMIVGTSIILPVCVIQDKIQRRRGKLDSTPESRLVFVCFLSGCMPAGLFWFGWTQFGHIHWIVPILGISCLTIGIFTVYLAVFNYFADVYGIYASSAMAAQSFCRNVASSVFPFFSNTMFINLGFAQASSLLGGIGVALMIAPIALMFNGPKIRARSNFMVQ